MMFAEGVQTAIIDMATRAVQGTALRPGQTFQGVVEASPEGLSVVVAGARAPLPAATHLTPGQTVTVEVAGTAANVQLRVTPLIKQSPAPAAPPAHLSALVSAVLESLAGVQPGAAPVGMLPAALPLTETAIRSLLSLIVTRSAVGDDLQQIAALLAEATAGGALPSASTLTPGADLLRQFIPGEPADLKQVLALWSERSGGSIEARIAQQLAAGRSPQSVIEEAQTDLRVALSRLREDGSLTAYLRGQGQLRAFQGAADRVLDRLAAAQLQNLHALDQSYFFVEMPFPANAPIRESRLHFYSEGQGKSRRFDALNAQVTLDLSTAKLGDLWITVQVIGGQCACRFAATSEGVVKAIDKASGELIEALQTAGYPRAHIHATLWDGDRLRETVSLMRRFAGLDLKA